jgi:hypothetical protein
MSDADSPTSDRSDDALRRDHLGQLSRSLTTIRLGVPLLDVAVQPTDSREPALLQDLCAATLTATLDLAALADRLIRQQRARAGRPTTAERVDGVSEGHLR